jgi:hypothetical protein
VGGVGDAQVSGQRTHTAAELERALSGRAVAAGDGMLHIERVPGMTMCGEPVQAYPLHWDVTTWVACGVCLMEAGVPLAVRG